MKILFLDLKWQHGQIKNTLRGRLNKIFKEISFVLGKDVQTFEDNFAKFLGVKYAIGVASGTDALILALKSLGLKKDDEVITIPTTFFATASAIVHAGVKPVFVDIDPETRNFNFDLLKKAINKKTRVILPVHLYGQPVDMGKINSLAKKYNLKVIEDACQAHGAEYKGQKVGTFGDLACFSFYPGKNLGAYGDGGAVVTNDDNLDSRLRKLRNHGGVNKYEHDLVGYNSRLDSVQAAVLDEKLKFLDKWNNMRIKVAERYNEKLKEVKEIKIYPTQPNTKNVFHLYIIKLLKGEREKFIKYLSDKEISTGIHYPTPLHLVPAFKYLGYKEGDFPVAEDYCKKIVSLPIFPGMTDEQIDYVIKIIKNYFHK